MNIQLSPVRIIKDAVTVWNEAGPEVDIVMDLKNLTFKENSLDVIYAFHVVEHFFPSEVPVALKNWTHCLKKGKSIFVVCDDFEILVRMFIGGEINIFDFNNKFSYPTNITADNLTHYLRQAGHNDHDMKFWYVDVPDQFKKLEYEIVIEATKP
jgi:predicted SAM-dependent methyltransferase